MKLSYSLMVMVFLITIVSQVSAASPEIRFYADANQTNLTLKDTCNINGVPCGASFVCNLTVIKPNQNYLLQQAAMFKQGDFWNYIQSNSSLLPYDLGSYQATRICSNGTTFDQQTWFYEITLNGNPPPSSPVILGYTILFIALVFGLVFLFLYAIGGMLSLRFDVLDVALNIGAFLALLAFQSLALFYLGNKLVNDMTALIIDIATWTNVFIPVIGFLLTMILGPFLLKTYPNVFGRMPGYKAPYSGEGALT